MRLIPPEDTPIEEVEKSPMTLTWNDPNTSRNGGHPGEYLLGLPCITGRSGHDTFIPNFVSDKLGELLGEEWWVDNRGSRIEISHVPLGPSNHELIMTMTTRVLEESVLPRWVSET